MAIEPAKTLPVKHLSKSSINLYQRCPTRWMRRYILGEREPASAPMLLGKTVGAAVSASLQDKINTREDWPLDDVLEYYSGEWDEFVEVEEIDWGKDRPGKTKDQGASLTRAYHTRAAPHVQPISVEREISFRLAGADWSVSGYIDYELDNGAVVDLKVRARSFTQGELDSELDPTLYLAARRAEGNPAPQFYYDLVKKTKEPVVERVEAVRTDRQLDRFLQRLAQVSQEIAWRTESGNWSGAPPGSWYCSEARCGFWRTCPFGGG